MCGIIGGTEKNWDYKNAIASLKHRGPDAEGILPSEDITLGFTRLSIIDLSEQANQPMTSTDRDISIVFNGEIYDFQTLRM